MHVASATELREASWSAAVFPVFPAAFETTHRLNPRLASKAAEKTEKTAALQDASRSSVTGKKIAPVPNLQLASCNFQRYLSQDMTRQQVLDLYFMDARSKLIDLAAFLDRVERAEGKEDFRLQAFRSALKQLESSTKNRAERVLLAFSDPTSEPVPSAPGKGAVGAWPGSA